MSEGKVAADDALRILLNSGDYSDLTIKCGDKEFKVHKAIVCLRSEYFAKACKPGAFKPLVIAKEGSDGIITLQAATESEGETDPSLDDPEAVKLMIDFLYCHDYEAPTVSVSIEDANIDNPDKNVIPSGDCNMVMHAKMYALGSKYNIPSLQAVALDKYIEAASYAWNTTDFVAAIHLVYTSTPDEDKGLRDITAETIIEHSSTLRTKPEIESRIRGIDGLTYDLFCLQSAAVVELKARHGDVVPCEQCGKQYLLKHCQHHGTSVRCECGIQAWIAKYGFENCSC